MDKLYNLANKVKDSILNEEILPTKPKYKPNIDIDEPLSPERLKFYQLMYKDVCFPSQATPSVSIENSNRFTFETNETKYLLEEVKKQYKSEYTSSGLFWCPPNGYCGWHTNSNRKVQRVYLVWAKEDNKSFFRYQDLETGEVVTKWEKKGWQVNVFTPPTWHCVGSFTDRISIGFRKI